MTASENKTNSKPLLLAAMYCTPLYYENVTTEPTIKKEVKCYRQLNKATLG